MWTLVSEELPLKQLFPIETTDAGISKDSNEILPSNAHDSIVWIPSANVKVFNNEQFWKADSFIISVPLPIDTFVIALHSANAWDPIVSTVSGILISFVPFNDANAEQL